MLVRWYGHSAFALSGTTGVFIDPFVPEQVRATFDDEPFNYPPIKGVEPDLVLVTHEHVDHKGIETLIGNPQVVRGGDFDTPVEEKTGTRRFETPLGEVTGIPSDHGPSDGENRPNTIFVFDFDGIRVCHFGDFGQPELHAWQKRAIGRPTLLFIPVGGTYTIGGKTAARIAEQLAPRLVVPMHYRTAAVGWKTFATAKAFLDEFGPSTVVKLDTPVFNPENHIAGGELTVLVPAVP
jgi:L-ascorbate metabolism protein UlaG (beta-lactamase superfamily)